MSNIFSKELTQPNNQLSVQRQPASDPVDNSTANTINAVTGLVKFGTDAYKQSQQEGTIKSVATQVNKNMTAVRQGKMKIGDADIKNSALLSEAITANPHLTQELRQITIGITGTDVTAEAFAADRLQEDQAAAREATSINTFMQTAASTGYAPRKADGSLDQQSMIDYGIKETQRQAKLASIKAQLGSMTAEERKDQTITKLEPVYNEFSEARLEALLATIDENQPVIGTGLSALEQEDALLTRIADASVKAERELRNEVIAAGGTSSMADGFVERFREQSKPYLDLVSGDRGVAGKVAAQAQVLKNAGVVKMSEVAPSLVAAVSSGIKVPLSDLNDIAQFEKSFDTEFKQPSTDFSQETSQTVTSYIRNGTDAIAYGKDFSTFSNTEKAGVFKQSEQVLRDSLKNFDKTTPNERIGFTNALDVNVQASTAPTNTAQGILSFANSYNKPNLRTALVRMSQDTGLLGKLTKTADTRINYIESIMKKARDEKKGLKYNPETRSSGNPLVDALLGNVDTFYNYSTKKDKMNIDKYKESLFVEPESSGFSIFGD